MKKLYVYQLWYDYSKNEYMFQMDYFYVEDKETYYKPIDVPEKPCITRSEIQKKRSGKFTTGCMKLSFWKNPIVRKLRKYFYR